MTGDSEDDGAREGFTGNSMPKLNDGELQRLMLNYILMHGMTYEYLKTGRMICLSNELFKTTKLKSIHIYAHSLTLQSKDAVRN